MRRPAAIRRCFGPVLLCAAAVVFAGCGANEPPHTARDLSRLEPVDYGKTLGFGSEGEGERTKVSGWAATEHHFTWSDGIAASLAVRLHETQDPVQLQFGMCGMNVPKRVPFQRVDLYLNGERAARWKVADEDVFTVEVPQKLVSTPNPLLVVDFYMRDAVSPAGMGIGPDLRRLGVRLSWVKISAGAKQAASADRSRGDLAAAVRHVAANGLPIRAVGKTVR